MDVYFAATGAGDSSSISEAFASDGGSIALGSASKAVGAGSVALGNHAWASGSRGNTVALGNNALASANDSVALGSNSVANQEQTVSIGTSDNKRRIVNVASGTAATDALNVSQLQGVTTTLGGDAAVTADGSIKAPSYSVQGATANTVGAALSSLDTAVSNNTRGISSNTVVINRNTRAISKLGGDVATQSVTIAHLWADANNLAKGAIGFIRQHPTDGAITVAKDTDGTTVNFKGSAGTRQLNGISEGAANTDAVNVSQLKSATTALGGGAAVKADGSIEAPSYLVQGVSTSNVGSALASLDTVTTKNTGDIVTNTTSINKNTSDISQHSGDISKLNTKVNNIADGATSFVQQNATSKAITIAKNTGGTSVDFTGSDGARQLTGVSKGAAETDAVNVSQLKSATTALGGGAKVNADGSIKAPSYLVQGVSASNVGSALASLDTVTTKNTGDIVINTTSINKNASDISTLNTTVNNVTSGTTGLVQQNATSKVITIAKNTGGTTLDLTGTAGTRQLNGVSKGAADTDAVNVSQLKRATTALGGGAKVNADGSIKAPSYVMQGTTVNNVGAALTILNEATTENAGDIVTNATSINKNAHDISRHSDDISTLSNTVNNISGSATSFIQQDATSQAITVAQSTGGTTLDLTGTAGTRQLNGVSKGAADTDAVNVSQLKGVTAVLGGNAEINADGSIKAPSYVVQGTTANNVGAALSSLDAATTKNTSDISSLGTSISDIASGTTGLVQQDHTTQKITIASTQGGGLINIAGSAGPRVMTGLANGVNNHDAVTVAQLKSVGLVDPGGKMMGAVLYDDISLGRATLGGTHGTVIANLANGQITADSLEAVNGGQLFTLQEQISDKLTSLNGRVNDLDDKVTNSNQVSQELSNNSGIREIQIIKSLQGTIDPSSGNIVIGTGAQATGNGSIAIGHGAAAPAANAVALGQGSLADRDNTVSVGSPGAERQITNVADGIAPTDAANMSQLNSRFDSAQQAIGSVARNAYAGIAAAMAMPNMTPSGPGRTIIAAGAANYKNGSAAAAGVTYRSMNERWLVNGAISVTSTGDAGVRTQVGYEF
ncbi:YadA-like family protein [Paraburkholderia bonniea]|uniref:YadA-like family protein n=1 Tax=Paraburkholderia bonniea TaxID=2152891 RepID=UPI001FE8B52F|nr:YadA-like family protein [Paraburkholderia bonniea]